MPIPDFQTLMLPFLKITGDGLEHAFSEIVDALAHDFRLSEQDRKELLPSGRQARFDNRVGWSGTYLKKAGLVRSVGRARFQLTDRGREILASHPTAIDINFLESRFAEMAAFRNIGLAASDGHPPAIFDVAEGSWKLREGIQDRVRDKMQRTIPDELARHDALTLLAFAIECSDEERGDAWYLRETSHGLALVAGRQLACKIGRSKVQVGVVGPISEAVRESLGAAVEDDDEFKIIPGSLLLKFPAGQAATAVELLKDSISSFIALAMAKVRRAVSLETHVPEAVIYIGTVLGRGLPQPEPNVDSNDSEEVDDLADDDDEIASREPRIRGRAPIFEHGQRSIASLISDIEREVLALPDLQRPFVWEDTRVRDLLDSLLRGFPVGTLVLWHTANEKEAKALDAERRSLRAISLVIDGQQRLTSLYAVMRGADIVGKDGTRRKITIAFRPRDGRFEVADAAIRNDPEFLPNVTELWHGSRPKPQIRRDLMNALRDKGRVVDDKYEDAVERNLDRAHALSDYRFPTVEIRKTAARQEEEATEEDVSEIFVRINNQGRRLGQADFVLTLLSVFHGELRDKIVDRARLMSTGSIVGIDTQQLLRAACAVAFGRARMSAVYRYLRGIDPSSGDADPVSRANRLDLLDDAANECMEPTPWRDYLLRVRHAGFVHEGLVASKSAIVNAYAFYIRGRRQGVPKSELDAVIARWVFGTLLSARYSGSSETIFEQDLGRILKQEDNGINSFVKAVDDALSERITGDFWTHELVASLETQKARSPAALAFRAAQIVLGARALFSDQLLQNFLDSSVQGGRTASELHHLFPQAWLHARGIHERSRVNQVANMADVAWYENSVIGGRGPAEYVNRVRERLKIDDGRWGRICAEHALPPRWEFMEYEVFLRERRQRMADIIRVAYRKLGGEADTEPATPPWFLPGAEAVWQRIAEVERALRTVVRDVYSSQFGTGAARKIEEAIPEREREILVRALRARPAGAEPLSVVDYLYLGQLPPLLFAGEAWQEARRCLGDGTEAKSKLQMSIAQIARVRNEIAHVREVDPNRLVRANLACSDILEMLRSGSTTSSRN